MFNTAEPPSTHLVFVCCPRGPRKLFNMEDIKLLQLPIVTEREEGSTPVHSAGHIGNYTNTEKIIKEFQLYSDRKFVP